MIYRIVITPVPRTTKWAMALYHTVPGEPDKIVRHERTGREYATPQDCCTSARHLLNELEKGQS